MIIYYYNIIIMALSKTTHRGTERVQYLFKLSFRDVLLIGIIPYYLYLQLSIWFVKSFFFSLQREAQRWCGVGIIGQTSQCCLF